MTDELGHTWLAVYDEFKRVKTTTDPLNRTPTRSYDLPGGVCGCTHTNSLPTKITLPSGKMTTIAYDLEWQKIAETVGFGSPDAATTQYGYDAAGNLTTVTDPRGKVWASSFDSRNRRISATDPLGNTTAQSYDAASNALMDTRPDNGVTQNVYDSMNRLTRTTDPKSQATQFGYDNGDNLISLTDARSNTYGFTYDLLNRQTRMTYPDASFEAWTYHDTAPAGQVATVYTTRKGDTLSCTFDNRNRDTFCDWSDTTPDVTKTTTPPAACSRSITATRTSPTPTTPRTSSPPRLRISQPSTLNSQLSTLNFHSQLQLRCRWQPRRSHLPRRHRRRLRLYRPQPGLDYYRRRPAAARHLRLRPEWQPHPQDAGERHRRPLRL